MRSAILGGLILAAGVSFAGWATDVPPSRKPGLWETKATSEAGVTTVRQCIDAGTDQLAQTAFGGAGQCSRRDIVKTAAGYEVDSDCKMGPVSATGKGLISGDFESKLHVETNVTLTGMPNQKDPVTRKTMLETAWIGPCQAGQSPGDIILPDGKIVKMPASHR